jgi:hypothetical protein
MIVTSPLWVLIVTSLVVTSSESSRLIEVLAVDLVMSVTSSMLTSSESSRLIEVLTVDLESIRVIVLGPMVLSMEPPYQ